jgi:hypothetical protein
MVQLGYTLAKGSYATCMADIFWSVAVLAAQSSGMVLVLTTTHGNPATLKPL